MEDLRLLGAVALFVLTLGGVSFWAGVCSVQGQLDEAYQKTEALKASIPDAMDVVCQQCRGSK
jgi:hypothetical protein